MKKFVVLVISIITFDVCFAAVPKTNNHGFELNNNSQTEKIVSEQKKNDVKNETVIKPNSNNSVTKRATKKISLQKNGKKETKVLVKEIKKKNSAYLQTKNNLEKSLIPENKLGNGGLVILAIFFPLLAVLIGFGLKKEFWICLLLHLLALIPAWIYAIVVLSR